ncbi:unnamed protein product [Leptidea sinapis]|uniref:RCC1-like domain-containing protein n=1 Tax=Leptidea sinapis TaxID=189913 RepID=A0A5E4QTU5_9NEOP|nr:unnamed protein product [Leptidea sinapis]
MFTLWSWGANSHGQLGLDVINEQIQEPTRLSTDCIDSIKQIACGGGHTLLLDNDGRLYSCGWNTKKQLALEHEVYKFQRVWSLSGVKFTNVACGWDFSCGVTDDNFLFVWGSNSHGQLGLPKEHFSEATKPIRLQVNACTVSMGLRHTAIINSKGEVWITGCGKHGQLGLGKDVQFSDRFQKVPVLKSITHVSCGQNHTVAWSSDEKALYVWGDNKHGQLLLNPEKYKKIYKPEKIDIDVRKKVKKLVSGWTNVLLWLEDGQILTWGRNNYGQLGTENPFEGNIIHVQLPDKRQVRDVVLGSEHTICLADDNTLWAWGWNEHSNTGTKSGELVLCPTLIPVDIQIKVEKIFSGGAHNFMLSS